MQLSPPKRFVASLTLLAALAGSACVKQNDPGVGLVKFESSAVFGITPKDEPAAPAFDVPQTFNDLPTENDTLPRILPRVDEGPCPAAKLTAFPKKVASVSVEGMPSEGLYTWKRSLLSIKNTLVDPAINTNLKFALQSRVIRRVVRANDHQFSFEMVSPHPLFSGNSIVTQFSVNTNKQLLVDRRVDSRTIGVVAVPGADVRLANPADSPGIFISGIEELDPQGNRVSSFKPVQPMLIAPLEGGILRSGQTFRSVGIDATSGNVITNDGVTGRTSRVDACGEIVEGYAITLHQVLTSDLQTHYETPVDGAANVALARETREVTYTFATQYGALPIAETLSIGDINVDPYAALGKFELGALDPKALPSNLK